MCLRQSRADALARFLETLLTRRACRLLSQPPPDTAVPLEPRTSGMREMQGQHTSSPGRSSFGQNDLFRESAARSYSCCSPDRRAELLDSRPDFLPVERVLELVLNGREDVPRDRMRLGPGQRDLLAADRNAVGAFVFVAPTVQRGARSRRAAPPTISTGHSCSLSCAPPDVVLSRAAHNYVQRVHENAHREKLALLEGLS